MENYIEKIYRHGDVILFKLKEQEFVFKTKEDTSELILAYGEVTGNKHVLTGDMQLVECDDLYEETSFFVKESAKLVHEEHDTIYLEKGYYLKVDQIEYNPFKSILQIIKD